MPRPRLRRRIGFEPDITLFKPAGVPARTLETVNLTADELEVLRLKDSLGLDQKQAAEKMQISQPTFHRTLLQSRKKIAEALTQGKAIKLQKNI